MEVQEFQKKLSEISAIAAKNDKILTGEQVRDFFAGMDLDKGQLLKILQYLKLQGISIEGLDLDTQKEEGKAAEKEEREIIPLTPEEEAYLKEYLGSLKPYEEDPKEEERLFESLMGGSEEARRELTERYLPVVASMAVEWNCEEILLADLIQEGNLGLLTGLMKAEGRKEADGRWLRSEILRGIQGAIREQTDRKLSDDCLVAKVQNLESAIRELTEDEEDGENKFSIGELAVILDMDVEEIRDVLRLTGDDQ